MSKAVQDRELLAAAESLDPADAFSLLGNEHRIRILEALATIEDAPVTFSALYDAVDCSDSALFNYHLDQLTGHFVTSTDAGYQLSQPGAKVVRAVLAGSINTRPRGTIAIDDPCVHCGSQLNAVYEDGMLSLGCSQCDHGHGEYSFPPGGLNDRTDAEVLQAFDQRVKHLHCLAKDGVCHECNGRVDTRLERDGDCCLGSQIRAEHTCRQCGYSLCSAIGLGLLDQSPVVAFYDDHGIDLATTPYWQLEWCVSDHPVNVISDDPWEIEVTITLDTDRLTLLLDETLAVLETTRTTG